MTRNMWLSIIVLVAAVSSSRAVIILSIHDPVDDPALVDAVSGQKPVKAFAAQIEALENILLGKDKEKIEKILGKPAPKPEKDYAIPIGQRRMFAISGIRSLDPTENKDHTAYYPPGDFAGIEVSYGVDGKRPQFAVLYFKMDDDFPRLKKVKTGDQAAQPRKGAVIRQQTIDIDHWKKMKQGMNKEEITALFSAPAGDYAPGTDYLTRRWGWRRGSNGKVYETLEWRSEKGRIVVEFDRSDIFVTSEFYYPGRDPDTNIDERLKWDRRQFDKVKKYLEQRLAK